MRRSFCPRRLKKLCFCTASHVLIAKLAVQIQSFFNILGQIGRRVTKDYSCICTGNTPHTFNFSASISSLYAFTQRASWDRVLHAKSRKVIWDIINTLFVTTVAVEPTFVAIIALANICRYVRVSFTLGERDFSSAVSGFCQVFLVTRLRPKTPKIPAVREKSLWYPRYVSFFQISLKNSALKVSPLKRWCAQRSFALSRKSC